MRSWKRLSSTRWIRTDTTCLRARLRFWSSFSRFASTLRVWSSTASGSGTAGLPSSTGPMPDTKPQPSTHASGGADMLEQSPHPLCNLDLALVRGQMVGIHVRHCRAPAELGERLGVRERVRRGQPHHGLVRIRAHLRALVLARDGRRAPFLHGADCRGQHAAREHDAPVGRTEVLALAVGDAALAHRGVVVARLALPLRVWTVAGLADEGVEVLAELLGSELSVRAVVIVEVRKADVQRMGVVERHGPAGEIRAQAERLLLHLVRA